MQHVLIVDDALDLGRLLKTALSMIDSTMPVVVVPSAEEALLEATRYPLDLLITDIRLPGISGVELIQKIRIHHPDVKIIAITGLSDDGLMKEIRDMGVEALFNKPLSIPEFTETAKRCLQLSSTDEQIVLKPVSKEPHEEHAPTRLMADVLTGFRQRMGANAVVLMDERARIAAQAGDLPDEFRKDNIFVRLQSAANASAGLSNLLGKSLPENVIACHGDRFDLVMAPIFSYTLFAILEVSSSNLRLALCFEETLIVQKELTKVLDGMGLHPALPEDQAQITKGKLKGSSQVEQEDEFEVDLEAFQAIFETSPVAAAGEKDANAFWEDLSDLYGEVEPENPDVLTYEQARQLGLAPKDEADN